MTTRIVLASRNRLTGRLNRESGTGARRNETMCRLPFRIQSTSIHGLVRHSVVPKQYSYLSLSTVSWNPILLPSPGCTLTLSVPEPLEHVAAIPLALSTITTEPSLVQRAKQRISSWIQRFWEFLSVTARSAEVAIRLSPLCILTPAAILSDNFSSSNDEPTTLSNVAWWYTLHALQSLGPAFVKLAQWAATRRDIFPPHICNRLGKLHDEGYTHSWRHSDRMLKQAFGDDYQEQGLVIHPNDIIGCGSAAQVYSGTLTRVVNEEDMTQPVAVKILHPRFSQLVKRDLQFFQSIADLLNALPSQTIKMLNLPRVADNFGVILMRQADLRVEAANLVEFDKNFALVAQISFPCPVEGWTCQNVLVETFVENAQSIADFLQDSTEEGWETRKELAGPLLNAFLKMVFWDNFVHADLHPGNVLIQTTSVPKEERNKKSWWWWWNSSSGTKTDGTTQDETKRTIVFLDAGIATSLSPNDRRNLRDLFRAVILNNGYEAGRLMVERAKYERCSQVDGGVEAFCNGVEEIVSEFHDRRKQGLTLGAVRIGGLLSRVLDLCRQHGVEIDPDMANVVISTLVLEGLGRSLHPDLNLIDCAIPFVLNSAKSIR